MLLTENAIEFIKRNLQSSDIQILFKSEWGSHNPSHREHIKKEIAPLLSNSSLHTSISHCDGWGVVVAASNPVGVDIELTSRVLPQVAERVSSAKELLLAPSPASLWTAKEACFKALRAFNQPSVISQISIGGWQNIDSQIETCKLLNFSDFNSPSENQGVILHSPTHTLSFFIFHS